MTQGNAYNASKDYIKFQSFIQNLLMCHKKANYVFNHLLKWWFWKVQSSLREALKAVNFKNFFPQNHLRESFVLSLSCLTNLWLFVTPRTAACQASLAWSITKSRSLLKLMSIDSVTLCIQPCHPLSSPSPPAFNLSQHQRLFQWVGSLHQVAKVCEIQLQHQSFK